MSNIKYGKEKCERESQRALMWRPKERHLEPTEEKADQNTKPAIVDIKIDPKMGICGIERVFVINLMATPPSKASQ